MIIRLLNKRRVSNELLGTSMVEIMSARVLIRGNKVA